MDLFNFPTVLFDSLSKHAIENNIARERICFKIQTYFDPCLPVTRPFVPGATSASQMFIFTFH